jgi:hypothetical protein
MCCGLEKGEDDCSLILNTYVQFDADYPIQLKVKLNRKRRLETLDLLPTYPSKSIFLEQKSFPRNKIYMLNHCAEGSHH